MNAEIDPYEHFIKYGEHEKRFYSFYKILDLREHINSYKNSKFKKIIPSNINPEFFILTNRIDVNFKLDPYEQIYKYHQPFPQKLIKKVKKRPTNNE